MVKNRSKRKLISEIYRDLLALSSPVMFLLVFVRMSIEPFRPFMDQVLFAGIFILLISQIVRFDGYSARAFPLAFFTSSLYDDAGFSIFAGVILIGILISSYKINKKKELLIGITVGLVSIFTGIFISGFTY